MSEATIAALVVAVIVAIPPTVAALINARRISELHILINSNLARQIAAEVSAAYSRGQIEGVRSERDRPPGIAG